MVTTAIVGGWLRSSAMPLADPVPGLQICDDAGCWHDVVPSPGSFIVNVGVLLVEWPNGRGRAWFH